MGHFLRVVLSFLAALILSITAAMTVGSRASAAPLQKAGPAVIVTTESSSYGTVLFTGSGQALYALSFDTDGSSTTPAISSCTGRCATIWVPLTIGSDQTLGTSGSVLASGIGTIPRPDSSAQTAFQVTYFGHPLYTFVRDMAAGETNGENVGAFFGLWRLVLPSGQVDPGVATVNVETSSGNTVLSTATAFGTSRSLYMLTYDPSNTSTCAGPCSQIWPALLTTSTPVAGNGVTASMLGTITRPDGTLQVTYNGHPLYLYMGDLAPGAASGLTNGDGYVDPSSHGVWYTVTASGNPQPAAMTIGASTVGTGAVLALQPPASSVPGLYTLYVYSTDTPTTSTCTGTCARFWPPLLTNGTPSAASGSTIDASKLGTITRSDGTTQATYNGRPLYLFVRDSAGTVIGDNAMVFGGIFNAVPVSGTPTTPFVGPAVASAQVMSTDGGLTASFTVSFTSLLNGQGEVLFGSGPGCSGLLGVATQDSGAGSNMHSVTVTGNDLDGSAGSLPVLPGQTYSFEVVTVGSKSVETNDNNGACYTVTIPSSPASTGS